MGSGQGGERAEGRSRFAFSHWIERQIGYDALLLTDRRRLHRYAAEAVETGGVEGDPLSDEALVSAAASWDGAAERAAPVAESTGRHWALGENPRRAGVFLLVAASSAWRRGDVAVASSLASTAGGMLETAGNGPGRTLAACVVARASRASGRPDEALRTAERALAMARDPVAGGANRLVEIAALHALAATLYETGDVGPAAARYEEALPICRAAHDPRMEAGCLRGLGAILGDQGRLQEAKDHLEAAISIARGCGERRIELFALQSLGVVQYQLGEYDAAERGFRTALEIARRTGELRGQVVCTESLGGVCLARAELDQADRWFSSALPLADSAGELRIRVACLQGIAVVRRERGELSASLEAMREGLETARAIRERRLTAGCLEGVAAVLRLAGDGAGAEAALAESLGIVREMRDTPWQAVCLTRLGSMDATAGRGGRARARLDEAVDLARRARAGPFESEALSARAECRRMAGDDRGARRDAARAVSLAVRTGNRFAAIASQIAAGLCGLRAHRERPSDRNAGATADGGAAWVELALAAARACGARVREAEALFALAHALEGTDAPRAARTREEALVIARRIGALGLLPETERPRPAPR